MTSLTHWDWETSLEAFTLLSGLFWLCMSLIRMMMARNFASHADHTLLDKRLAAVEQRLGPVERGVAVLGEQVQSVKEGVSRTEHMVSILLEHSLKEKV
jgi:hypothetical protein